MDISRKLSQYPALVSIFYMSCGKLGLREKLNVRSMLKHLSQVRKTKDSSKIQHESFLQLRDSGVL